MRLLLIAVLTLGLVLSTTFASSMPVTAHAAQSQPTHDMTQVIVEMTDVPAVQVYTALRGKGERVARQTTQDDVRRLDQAQRRLMPAITRLGGTVLYRMQRVYQGMAVLIPADHVSALRALPGVKAIHPAVIDHVDNANSVPLINTPAAWAFAGGLTGKGQKIAIIDTGIDYTHADFGGAGTDAAFLAADADPTVVEPGTGFPSAKIAGGIDLVGDTYDASGSGPSTIPRPDPDPLDCYGHGSHVAGTAGGLGVSSDGHPFHGPYTGSVPFASMKIGPGVAPDAQLYAVKIFGCSGSTIVTPAAIEWAIDPNGDGDFSDRMDVINMSLGSPFGTDYDATTIAADNAAKAGIVVVASAGNQGDTYYDIGTPSSADGVISVTASSSEDVASFSSRGPRRGDSAIKPDIAAPGEYIYSAARGGGTDGTYLSGTSMASPHVAGAAALMRQLNPSWSVEEIKAALMDTAKIHLHTFDGTLYSPIRAGAGRIDVGRAVHTNAVAYNADNPGLVSLSFGAPEVVDRLMLVKNLRIANKATTGKPVTYTLGVTQVMTATGVTITPALSSVTLGPGASTTVPILFSITDARQIVPVRDQTMLADNSGQARHFLNEITGFITLTPTDHDQQTLSVSYFAAPRKTGTFAAGGSTLHLGAAKGTATLVVHGTTSAQPALVSLYELQQTSPKILPSPTEHGTVSEAGEAADLQYIGIASDYPGAHSVANTSVAFGLATYAAWSTPNEVTFEIEIDANLDGKTDYVVTPSDAFWGGDLGDVFYILVRDESSGAFDNAGRLNYLDDSTDSGVFNSRVAGFTVNASQIGLSDGHSRFTYRVRTYHLDVTDHIGNRVLVDESRLLTYDVTQPGFDTTTGATLEPGAPLYDEADGSTYHIHYNAAALRDDQSKGLLLLQHNDVHEQQAQFIPITVAPGPLTPRLYLPLLGARR